MPWKRIQRNIIGFTDIKNEIDLVPRTQQAPPQRCAFVLPLILSLLILVILIIESQTLFIDLQANNVLHDGNSKS